MQKCIEIHAESLDNLIIPRYEAYVDIQYAAYYMKLYCTTENKIAIFHIASIRKSLKIAGLN